VASVILKLVTTRPGRFNHRYYPHYPLTAGCLDPQPGRSCSDRKKILSALFIRMPGP